MFSSIVFSLVLLEAGDVACSNPWALTPHHPRNRDHSHSVSSVIFAPFRNEADRPQREEDEANRMSTPLSSTRKHLRKKSPCAQFRHSSPGTAQRRGIHVLTSHGCQCNPLYHVYCCHIFPCHCVRESTFLACFRCCLVCHCQRSCMSWIRRGCNSGPLSPPSAEQGRG